MRYELSSKKTSKRRENILAAGRVLTIGMKLGLTKTYDIARFTFIYAGESQVNNLELACNFYEDKYPYFTNIIFLTCVKA